MKKYNISSQKLIVGWVNEPPCLKIESFSGAYKYSPRQAQANVVFKGEGFRLKDMVIAVGIPEETYYHYHVKNAVNNDSDPELKTLIGHLFKKFHERCGYKRITNELKNQDNPIMDLSNREVIVYGIKECPSLDLVIEPLKDTIETIKNHAIYQITMHSDQGWRYQRIKWIKALKDNKVFQNMSRKATCADNASMEHFFEILKKRNILRGRTD